MGEDFFKAMEMITTQKMFSTDYNPYDRVYPYTTENINGYLNDVSDKEVLSVIGSGDHYLNLISMGAKLVDNFDINKFAIHYLRLKKAAVKALNKREFFEFLTNDSKKHFEKVKDYLDINSYNFWSNYIKYFTFNNGIQASFLFYPRTGGGDYIKRNIYLTDEGYERLKENIMEKREDYYQGDIYTLVDKLDKKYDAIYLSNICSYQSDLEKYKDLVLKLRDNNLKDNGELYYGYFYKNKGFGLGYYNEVIDNTEVIEVDGVFKEANDKVYKLTKKNS